MFNEYPYVNLQDVNLDWILKHIKDLETNLQDFVKLNTIKYADPIIWNITKQYETNTVVIDGNTGTAYLSVQPVPAGVALTNTDYWTVIFTLNLTTSNQNITFRDDGTNVVATFDSNTGDWLLWNFYLYRVTQPISVNTAYLEGFNLERFSVELFIRDYINTLKNAIEAVIGDLDDLTTSDKTSIVNAINSVLSDLNTKIGDLQDLETSDKTSVVNAINSVLSDINTEIGDLQDLETSDKTSVVNAINSVINDSFKSFDTVSDVISASLNIGDKIYVRGYYNIGDGGDGYYSIDNNSGDAYVTLSLNNGLYAHLIINSRELKADSLGCKYNDSSFDNSVILNSICTNSNFDTFNIVFSANNYYFKNTVTIQGHMGFIGTYKNFNTTDHVVGRTRLTFTDATDAAITVTDTSQFRDLVIYGTFTTTTINRAVIGETTSINRNWITFNSTKQITAIKSLGENYNVLVDGCLIRGFYTGVITGYWSRVSNCIFKDIENVAIYLGNDSMVTNIKAENVGTIITTANLSVISNIRGDSIKKYGIQIGGTGNNINNIQIDYVGRNAISAGNSQGHSISNVSSRYGIDYINVDRSTLSSDDLIDSCLIGCYLTKTFSIVGIDGRQRTLDDGKIIGHPRIGFYGVKQASIIMGGGDTNNILTSGTIGNYVYNENSCTYKITIGSYDYFYKQSSSASNNVTTPTLQTLT